MLGVGNQGGVELQGHIPRDVIANIGDVLLQPSSI